MFVIVNNFNDWQNVTQCLPDKITEKKKKEKESNSWKNEGSLK